MENNFFFQMQNIFTIAPLILSGMAFLLIITGRGMLEKVLLIHLVTMSLCISMLNFGWIVESVWFTIIELGLLVGYVLIYKRKC